MRKIGLNHRNMAKLLATLWWKFHWCGGHSYPGRMKFCISLLLKKKHLSTSMSPHCQVTSPNSQLHIAKSPTPFHCLGWRNILQIAQNNFFTSCPMPEIYSFSAQIYALKKKIVQLSLNSKKGSIVFFSQHRGRFWCSFYFSSKCF